MGGFNDNRDQMHALQQQAMAQQTQGVVGLAGQLGGQSFRQHSMDQYMADRAIAEREAAISDAFMRSRHESEKHKWNVDYFKRTARPSEEFAEMMRLASDPVNEGVNIGEAARHNLKVNARDIDKAGSVREFLQAETDDWLEDSLKIN